MTWKQFHFGSNLFFDKIAGPEDWLRLKADYSDMSDDDLLNAKEATYGGHRTKADRDDYPNYGLRSEHDGTKRLREFFEENDMLRLIPGRDAKDAARYRWLRAQHWIEGTVSVVSAKSVIPGSECQSYQKLDEVIDRMMLDTSKQIESK